MCGRAGALGESWGEQAYVRKREGDYVWMKPGTLQKFRLFLLFIMALPVGMGLRVPPHPGRTRPSWWERWEHRSPVSRLIKAQPCLQVTQVMNPLQGACWL